MLRWPRLLLAATLIGAACIAQAAYPDKLIRLVVGFPPGTSGDSLARTLGQKLSEQMGQPVVVDNRIGAGSSIGAEAVARAPADGYTLLLSTSAQVINPSLSVTLRFDFARDLVPVMLLAQNPAILFVAAPSPLRNLQALVSQARATPGKLTYATPGVGTFTHLYGELFAQSAGIKLTHVPYKGSTGVLTDVLGGIVNTGFTTSSPVIGQVKAGKLRALAVVGSARMAALPDVPTFAESGIVDLDSSLWFGLNAPAGTPQTVLTRLERETRHALETLDVKAQLAAQEIEVTLGGPDAFRELITRDLQRWSRVVRNAGVKVE